MKGKINWWRNTTVWFCAFLMVGGMCVLVNQGIAKGKNVGHEKAFALYAKKCLSCHDSVADPEKPGRTRDDWHLVVNVMHQYGLDMTADEGGMIIDLLYDLRKGMEREAG
jgi:hypothetical protein